MLLVQLLLDQSHPTGQAQVPLEVLYLTSEGSSEDLHEGAGIIGYEKEKSALADLINLLLL